ncbi:helix-turn-helix domain-containing protein [Stenotrophomonas sp. CFBP8994]|uniref:helix-turn-helix domain-containing protein n=1 Tax=Stenotrophomonas sp. CFBP8994 TaxID=3096527 RepID=UPI002A6A2D7B|nr:helix-turn-helix domain-containing protein [Stenotrophomonas sp. CFBP8994]MDY0978956.1 helix-turn-helix domain-containing protein [Stenotrophomonas sp. CFBP8994]
MPTTTLGQRLQSAMQAAQLRSADLARAADTTTATISNWLNDNVVADHVKAVQLFKIADAVQMDARELLLGERSSAAGAALQMPSQPLTHDTFIVAFQLVAEALDERGLQLPPQKRAQVTLLAYELLQEDMPRAKVLRFVQASAA